MLHQHLEHLAVVHGAVALRDAVEVHGAVEDLARFQAAVEDLGTTVPVR